MFLGSGRPLNGPVHPAYNPYFSACFFIRNSVFLSQQISQQCFSAGLSAQPNKAIFSSIQLHPENCVHVRGAEKQLLVRSRFIQTCLREAENRFVKLGEKLY
jgi:hypothetical protein